MKKVLILGSSGLLGSQIYKKLKNNKKIKLFHNGLKKKKIDLLNSAKLRKLIISTCPNLIINSVGFTNIEKCEKNKIISKKINFGIVKELFDLKKEKKLNFNLIQISTDQFYKQKKKQK